MKLLVVRTTSFGDIVHTFPALTDARRRIHDLVCDWLIEDTYAAMPGWHPAVREVIPVSMRGWRRAPWINHPPAILASLVRLRRERYDLVLDAQGLLKSAVLSRLARGPCAGYDRRSAREPWAAALYHRKIAVTAQHAVDRNRELFAGALQYDIAADMDYGLNPPQLAHSSPDEPPYLVFIPGTTWPSKRWPSRHWRELAAGAAGEGWRVRILSGTASELETARSIGRGLDNVEPVGPPSLDDLAGLLRGARAVVSVDSGPGHLAAAVGTPGVSIYGATDPEVTGIRGAAQVNLKADFECAPCLRHRCQFTDRGQVYPDCYATVPPERVWSTLRGLIQER